MANKEYKKALAAAVTFDWTDYIGGPYSYVDKFVKDSATDIIYRAPINSRIVKALNGAKRISVDELTHNGQRFYEKARIAHIESKSGRVYTFLISYNTAVCMIDSAGRFIKLWHGYSATTARHIAAFMQRYGLPGMNKKEWLLLPVGKWNGETEVA